VSDKDDDNLPETDDVDTDRVDDDGTDGEPEGADQLGDAGKKALDAMKARVKAEREKRRAAEAELAQLKGKAKPDETPDVDDIRAQARAEAQAEALRERALDKIEAKAAKLFADPEDARALLAAQVGDFVDDGKIDVEAITDALEELLKKKPHLAASAPRTPRTPAPDRSQGSRGSGPADLDALIAEAEKRGDTRTAIALKTRKLTQTSK